MTVPELAHFYHVYAAGDWAQPVTEHCDALVRFGLYDELTSLHVGFVGSPEQIAAARATLDVLVPKYQVCAESPDGWEQETLDPLYRFVQDHDGYVSYAHTKGASRRNAIDATWRRMMTYHCIVDWQTPVTALDEGKAIAGCYWIRGGPSSIPGFGHGGMFGGNFWWTRCDLLRRGLPPGRESRHAAEHWLGQLSEVTPITADTICELEPRGTIGEYPPDWLSPQYAC